jgi:1-acyl-sn-glycerol-3-phosphate acyltransferase
MDYINFRLNKMPKIPSIAASLLEKAYGIFAGLAFTAVTVPTIVLMLITPGETNRRRLGRGAARLFLWISGIRPTVAGMTHLPAGPCVIVANHASYLDGIILTAVLPPRFTFVIKREMTRVPFAHFLLRRLGSEFVERSDQKRRASDARRIVRKATNKRSLAFFPEGTFKREPGLRRFHFGAFTAARRARLPLVPVIIRGSRTALPANQFLPVRSSIEVIIRPGIDPQIDGKSANDLMNACRWRILEELDEPDVTGTFDRNSKVGNFI